MRQQGRDAVGGWRDATTGNGGTREQGTGSRGESQIEGPVSKNCNEQGSK